MKNVKEHPASKIQKINTVYMIALVIYFIFFLTTTFTLEKFYVLTFGIIQGVILLILEERKIKKS